MRIAFLIERNIYFKIFGPVIDRALERGHQVFCFHNYSQSRSGSKGYQFPNINQVPKFKNGKVVSLSFKSKEEFIEECPKNNIQVVVSLNMPKNNIDLLKHLKQKGIYWVALQNVIDTVAISGDYLNSPDKFFIYSPEWIDWMLYYLKKTNQNDLKNKIKAVGFWMAEQKEIINPKDIKRKWSISENKKVVLLLPFPFGSSKKTFWTKYTYRTRFFSKENDLKVSNAIRRFCDNNNAILLVKCRKKDPAKRYLKKIADKILYDEDLYPSTIFECFSVADICFNFYSTAVIEAISMNVPNVCIAPNVYDWQDIATPLWQSIFSREKDFFDFPGVSYLKTIPEIINNLANQTFADFSLNKEKQALYLQKFANNNTENASENIILEIEKLIEKE